VRAHPTSEHAEEAARRIAVLRGLYDDLADEFNDFERRRELWAQVDAQHAALAKLIPHRMDIGVGAVTPLGPDPASSARRDRPAGQLARCRDQALSLGSRVEPSATPTRRQHLNKSCRYRTG
jgi:hypothetical protein